MRAEFKKTTGQLTAAAKTVCAMLNSIDGIVVFDVTDEGEIMESANSGRRGRPCKYAILSAAMKIQD